MSDERSGGRARRGRAGAGQARKSQTSPAEWIVALIAALLVLGAIGQLLVDAFTGPEGPPELVVRVDSMAAVAGDHRVSFTIRNDGGRTAARVHVEGRLMRDSTAVETSTVTVDYVPSQSTRRGGLLFTRDPAAFRLDVRATGYDTP